MEDGAFISAGLKVIRETAVSSRNTACRRSIGRAKASRGSLAFAFQLLPPSHDPLPHIAPIMVSVSLLAPSASAQESSPPATAPLASPSGATEPSVREGIRVVIDSSGAPVTLLRINGFSHAAAAQAIGSDDLTEECTSPCEISVDRNALYRIAGPGVVPSGFFGLPADGDVARLRVRRGFSREEPPGSGSRIREAPSQPPASP
jgi:hypothetical protein